MSTKTNSVETAEDLVARLRGGDVRALARAVSAVEQGGGLGREVLRACAGAEQGAVRIGFTGPPGAGKSTLVSAYARLLRERGETVGVVAVDPTSPLHGGAILGDRIRMQGEQEDAGLYIRSVATRGALGGLAAATADICRVIAASGKRHILIETVGVGQDEVEIARLADVTVVVLVPGMGDDVQSIKAGLMEIADVFVVNKSDREGAERVESDLRAMQGLAETGGWAASVVKTVATTGEGVAALHAAVERYRTERPLDARRMRTEVLTGLNGLRLDHMGVAVRSIAEARRFYELLGLQVTHEETVEHEQVKTAMLPLGGTRVELLEPTAEDSVIGRYLAKRGEGVHHIAVHVPDLEETLRSLRERGVRLVNEEARTGAGGHRYFFVHPASTGGVLLEIVGEGTE